MGLLRWESFFKKRKYLWESGSYFSKTIYLVTSFKPNPMPLLDWLKRPFDAIASSAEERIKHPFIGSFMLAWVAFNWKPILFLLVGSMKIEDKISFIEAHYSSLQYLVVFPLITSSIYVLALPYFSWAMDWLLQRSVSNRVRIMTDNKVIRINAQTRLAIENIKKERAEAEYKDLKETNKIINELEQKVGGLENQINIQHKVYEDKMLDLTTDFERKEKLYRLEFKDRQQELQSQLNSKMEEADKWKRTADQLENALKIVGTEKTENAQKFDIEIQSMKNNTDLKIKELRAAAAENDREIENLKKEKEAIEADFNQLKSNYETDIPIYEQRLKEAENLNKKNVERIEGLATDKDKLLNQVMVNNTTINRLEKKHDKLIIDNRTHTKNELVAKALEPKFYKAKSILKLENGIIMIRENDTKELRFFDNNSLQPYIFDHVERYLMENNFTWESLS